MRISAILISLLAGLLLAVTASAQSEAEVNQPDSAPEPGPEQSAGPPPGQQMSHWIRKAANAYQSQDIEGWVEATRELHKLRPYNQDFMRQLVEGNALLGNLREAFNIMLKMQQQGLSVDWDAIEAVEPLREHSLYDHLKQLMTEAGQPFGDASTWSTLDSEHAMPEAMAFDSASERIFVGTIRDGEILVSEDGESWDMFASPETVPELASVFDIAVDAERRHLWAAVGRVSHYQGPEAEEGANSALLRLDLENGELQEQYTLSTDDQRNLIGSLTLAGDGTIFAADTQAPIVYRLEPGQEQIKPYFAHPNFTSLRGIALNDDDSLLYVADYELGILVVDATGGEQAWQLAVPETFNAGGIDGLYWWNDHLVAIQNGISPQRVVRLELGPDGLGVTSVAPLAAAKEEFDTPTFGTMDGQMLYFLAGSHWPHVDQKGNAVDNLPDVPIMQLDVDAASVQVVGQQVLEQLKRQGRGVPIDEQDG
ncbi:SMP-30/gluconolactonase/LRE family protein [Wenzhouxiangella sp. EGI_FJ10305]|uniref:SMP-30/gluconolactonase/LRE family protein n=1 Tax=Wenzhouxiangella sp. EGI_FJ10305 TaxID=3243768 RepID=UPI0035E3BCE4